MQTRLSAPWNTGKFVLKELLRTANWMAKEAFKEGGWVEEEVSEFQANQGFLNALTNSIHSQNTAGTTKGITQHVLRSQKAN